MPLFAERYELGPVIGRGGMAEVRGAHDSRLERPVAIKIMRPEVAHQPLVRERFESEARLAARLMHPNVVSVFDSGEEGGLPYIVMERLPGDTLHDRLAHGPMSETETRKLALEVLAALETAHAAGILHRDIKPANILATGDGHWKVADFGIAKALEVNSGDATATGVILGTPSYLAPERLLGQPATVASDLYALGVVLYEALTGRRPFGNGSPEGWAGVVATTPLVALATIRPGLDPVLAGAVERCLAADASMRLWSAAEMSASIRGADAGEGGRAGPVAAAAAATEVMAAGPATEVLAKPPGAPDMGPARTSVLATPAFGRRRRSPVPAVLAALAGAAVLTLIAIAAAGSGSHSRHGGSPAGASTTAATATSAVPATTAASTTSAPTSTTTSSTSTTTTTALTITVPVPRPGPGGGKPHKH